MKPTTQIRRCALASALCTILLTPIAKADVSLPSIIGDNMVLQEGKPVLIWGSAASGEKISVAIGGQTESTTADADGKWRVKLKALPAGGPMEITVTGKNTLTIKNVLIGRVWLCSGQSNMVINLAAVKNKDEIKKASYPKMRFFKVAMKNALQPLNDCAGSWVECDPATAVTFSAVAYYFGRELHTSTGEPVGLICSAVGATGIGSWTSLEGMEKNPELKAFAQAVREKGANLAQLTAKYESEELPKYEADLKAWQEESKKMPPGSRPTRQPRKPDAPADARSHTTLYNGMIAPLVPFAIEGVIWYQGEQNVGGAASYRARLRDLIADWREKWSQGDFPFLIVQLANFMEQMPEPTKSAWAALREAQAMALSVPHTGLAVTIDIGEADNIHPTDKYDVGHRLFLAAERVAMGKKVVLSPMYDGMKVEEGKIRVTFKDAGSGLVIGVSPLDQGPGKGEVSPDTQLKGFAIAGEDQKWAWAQAEITGDNSVLVWSEQISHPVAVRYAWANNPACNLYNKEGLPAAPFRTDDWER